MKEVVDKLTEFVRFNVEEWRRNKNYAYICAKYVYGWILYGSRYFRYMRFLRCYLLVILMVVPVLMRAQDAVLSEDSIVSIRDLHRVHRLERKARGPLGRRDMGDGRQTVISLRSNMLRWLTFTPELGLIWHCAPRVDVQINAAWTSLTVSDRYRKRYALWLVSPEVRYYLGTHERYYVGLQGEISMRNYRLRGRDEGQQGRVYGGGLTGGYQWRLSRHTSLDLHVGVGYNAGKMSRYNHTPLFEGQKPSLTFLREENEHRFGINHLGVSLVWDLGGRKGDGR